LEKEFQNFLEEKFPHITFLYKVNKGDLSQEDLDSLKNMNNKKFISVRKSL
jgi:hypothetical protein